MSLQAKKIIAELKSLGNAENVAGMAHFGINTNNVLGITVPQIQQLAKKTGKDHALALELWKSEIHEARILAAMIDDPKQVTEKQMESWAKDFDSWDVCDQVCGRLFDKTIYAFDKAIEWCYREEEFVKRAGFVLMASLAVHDKKADNKAFINFLSVISEQADDERNFVKKAINWALRQIGKRNIVLHKKAIKTAEEIKKIGTKACVWIAADALRELQNEKIILRIKSREV